MNVIIFYTDTFSVAENQVKFVQYSKIEDW